MTSTAMFDTGPHLQQRLRRRNVISRLGGQVGDDVQNLLGVRAALCSTAFWARRILDAAISDMALVTLPVFSTLRMRRRMSLTLGILCASFPLPLGEG